MTEGRVPPIREAGFTAEVTFADPVVLVLAGSADTVSANALPAFIRRLHRELVDLGAPRVIVDLRGLEFMNAAGFAVFVDWVEMLHELPDAHRYHLYFRTSPTIHWQRRSLRTLSTLATQLVEIEA